MPVYACYLSHCHMNDNLCEHVNQICAVSYNITTSTDTLKEDNRMSESFNYVGQEKVVYDQMSTKVSKGQQRSPMLNIVQHVTTRTSYKLGKSLNKMGGSRISYG